MKRQRPIPYQFEVIDAILNLPNGNYRSQSDTWKPIWKFGILAQA